MSERFAVWKEFQRIGRELFLAGLNNTHSGNMSVRLDERRMLITRTGAMLGNILLEDLVEVDVYETGGGVATFDTSSLRSDDAATKGLLQTPKVAAPLENPQCKCGSRAVTALVGSGVKPQGPHPSVELPLHRAVYQHTAHRAIVHAHPPGLIALSLKNERIIPIDEEGKYYTPEGVRVVSALQAIGSGESATVVAAALRDEPGVVLRGHGMFAGGKDLEAAGKLISSAEHSARILLNYIVTTYTGGRE